MIYLCEKLNTLDGNGDEGNEEEDPDPETPPPGGPGG